MKIVTLLASLLIGASFAMAEEHAAPPADHGTPAAAPADGMAKKDDAKKDDMKKEDKGKKAEKKKHVKK